jgi:hypothetical protein
MLIEIHVELCILKIIVKYIFVEIWRDDHYDESNVIMCISIPVAFVKSQIPINMAIIW